jgi:sulfur-oxidizing protein SoxA
MRCAELAALLALCTLAAAPVPAQADAALVRQELLARLKKQMPDLPVADYGLGAAAFDRSLAAGEDDAATTIVATGRELWRKRFRNGKSLASCFPNGGKGVAANYPQFDARLKKIVTLETAVNQCLILNKEAPFDPSDARTMGATLAWVRSQAAGRKIAVRVASPAAEERFDAGRALFFMRTGRQNLACASCHVQGAGRVYEGTAIPPAVGLGAPWPAIRGTAPVAINGRMRECLARMGAAPVNFSADDLANVEYFLAYLANGYALLANVTRRD